jgi:DNA-binding transcriptional LysR family regulator
VARADTAELAGTLRLHAPAILASFILAPLLAGFRQRYPSVLIDVEVASPRELPIEDFDLTLMLTDEAFDADIVARKVGESELVLVASPEYLKRRGTPRSPEELREHDCIRLRALHARLRMWRLWQPEKPDEVVELESPPVISGNHTDTMLRAALDGAGIASAAMDLVAPYLARGELVRVLAPWISGHVELYAALPSRKFIPQRTRAFLDYLIEQTRDQHNRAMQVCAAAHAAAALRR